MLALLVLGLAFAGCRSGRKNDTGTAARFYLETGPGEIAVPVVLPRSGVRVMVASKPVLTEWDMVEAEVAEVEDGRCLALQFTPEAAGALLRLSETYPNRRLVLLLDGIPAGVRVLDEPIVGGRMLVFVEKEDRELGRLAARLKRGGTTPGRRTES